MYRYVEYLKVECEVNSKGYEKKNNSIAFVEIWKRKNCEIASSVAYILLHDTKIA